MSDLQRQLRWYIGIRLVAAAGMALPDFLQVLSSRSAGELAGGTPGFFAKLFGLTCLVTLVYIALLRPLRSRPEIQAYIQFFGDLLLITALVWQFGSTGPSSPLYLIVIAAASTLLRRKAGFFAALAAYLLYAPLQLALSFGYLVSPSGGQVEGLSPRLVYSLLAHFVGFFAVARLTSLLASSALRAEAALEEKREDLARLQVVHRDVIESSPSGIATADLDGTLTSLNRAGHRILGKEYEQLVGQRVEEWGLFDRDQWTQFTQATENRGRFRSEVNKPSETGVSHIGFTLSRLKDRTGEHRGYIVVFQDLTRWHKLEEEVRMKEKMAAVGTLAAGLAHEIGNPLAAISGSVQMLTQSATPKDAKLLEIILKESQRLDRTIKGFLRFARPRERSSMHFDIAALLSENIELLRNSPEVTEQHSVSLKLSPSSAYLVGDPDQISQIFWNLARNALKAMPNGGELSFLGKLEDDNFLLQVADTGKGMSAEERANLFHPFQSFFDSGTGLGMAIVYRIVQDHGGKLQVESQPGKGTTITVSLPALVVPVQVTP